ncbi:two-component system, sensor histidine kinase YesM [Gracilibacillus orientalis]|uniref:histidine kinase n=1 Tax=Gracilibacillus orientalis TaxID=334253 RepID=A0A1I4ICH9_9BACI|nr:sensor histidine kinase [Gracilibacillus orientalis]SFL52108.1 two-component system, sensor histidine kinase YesM [Gracilibacillus orientalis]
MFLKKKIMSLFDYLKVKHKLLGIYLIVTAIPILLVGAYLNYSTRDIVLNHSLSEAESNVDKLELRLQTIFNRVISIADMVYINQNMKELLENDYESTLEIYNAYNRYPVFDDFLKYYDEIETIQFFMNKDMITDSHFIYADSIVKQENWYQEAVSKSGRLSWVYMDDYWTGQELLALTRAVYGQSNDLLGVLAIYVSPDMLKSVVEGEPYQAFITLDQETIVYNTEREYIGEKATFFTQDDEQMGNYVIDTDFQEEHVKINVHDFQPDKSLDNSFQVSSVIPVDEVMKEPNAIYVRGFLVIIGALTVSIFLIGIFIRSFHKRIQQLRQTMFQVAKGNFQVNKHIKGRDEISEVYRDLATTSESVQKIIDEVYIHKIKEETWKRKQKEMDFKMLASQINPHFLYNTLEMIRMKAILNQDPEVAKIVKMLSKMMRSSLERTDRPVPITEEIALMHHYLEIQILRFGEKFSYKLEVEDGVEDYYIFPLLIQPIVENAIIHGLEPKEEDGFVKITMEEEDQYIQVEVKDNGAGMPKANLIEIRERLNDEDYYSDGNRIGLHNVHQRLRLYYGDKYGIEMDSIEGLGTTMTLKIPKIKNDQHERG